MDDVSARTHRQRGLLSRNVARTRPWLSMQRGEVDMSVTAIPDEERVSQIRP